MDEQNKKEKNSHKVDISIVVTAHKEARLLQHTLNSIKRARLFAKKENISTELIVMGNSVDEATKKFLNERISFFNGRVVWVDFREVLGYVRNESLKHTQGAYITFIDGDNCVSENWLNLSFKFAQKKEFENKDTAFHPEYFVGFGSENAIWRQLSSTDDSFRYEILMGANYWDSMVFAKKEVFLKVPYNNVEVSRVFGVEDWFWNCETLAQGIAHIVVPASIFFYRKRGGSSMLAQQLKTFKNLPGPTEFFNPEFYLNLFPPFYKGRTMKPMVAEKRTEESPPKIKLILNKKYPQFLFFHKRLRRYMWYEKLIHKNIKFLAAKIEAYLKINQGVYYDNSVVPRAVVSEWRKMQFIDPALYCDSETIRTLSVWHVPDVSHLGLAYLDICRNLKSKFTDLVVLPWLVTGGADLVAINTINALARKNGRRVLVITTEDTSKHPMVWLDRLLPNVDILEFGKIFYYLSKTDRELLLFRVAIQFGFERLFVMNSNDMFSVLVKYGHLMKHILKIHTFAFCEEFTNEARFIGYLFIYLNDYFDCVTKILTDNSRIGNFLSDIYGFERDKFFTTYQPVKIVCEPKKQRVDKIRLKIVWAGRIDKQKRVDILILIAKKCQKLPVDFVVYGSSILDNEDHYIVELEALPNVKYKGAFSSGVAGLAHKNFDLFLYTSQYDGLPNVLLEATSVGLPIVAPNVGGISELIENHKTGILIPKFDDVEAYVEAIKFALNNFGKMVQYAEGAQKLIKERHSQENFDKAIDSII